MLVLVEAYMRWAGTPEYRRLMATLRASPALLTYERHLHYEGERQLRDALAEAWEQPHGALDRFTPADPRMASALVAAIWVAAVRTLLVEQRDVPRCPDDSAAVEAVVRYAEKVLDRLEHGLLRPDERMPVLRAG
jgi:hypothetical protein